MAFFDSGGVGSPPAAVPAVKEQDPAIQQVAADAARRRRMARGIRSTILGSQMMNENSSAMQETFGA